MDWFPHMPTTYWATLPLWMFLIIHGGIISYYDLKFERIKNKHILITFGVGIVWYAFIAIFGNMLGLQADPAAIATNTLLALAIAFGMYYANLWSPADAKWYVALVFVIPLTSYQKVAVDFVPGIVLLVNAYICAFLFIFGEFLLRSLRRIWEFFKELKQYDAVGRQDRVYRVGVAIWEYLPKFFVMAVGVAFVMVLLRIVMVKGQAFLGPYLHLKPATIFLIIFLLFNPLYRLMRIKWVFIPVLFALVTWVVSVLVQQDDPQKASELLNIGYVSISLILFRELYSQWQKGIESQWIEIDELEPRHVLSENTKSDLVAKELFSPEDLAGAGIDGLSDEQIALILREYRHETYHGFIEVQKTIPFGPFLYLGLIATMLAHGVFLTVQRLFG